jgi:hypothetical protein
LLDSTVFIWPGVAGTRGAPGAALCDPGAALSQEVGTRAVGARGAPRAAMRGPGAALSQEVRTGAAVTHGAPRAAHVERWVLPPELPRADLLLAISDDFFFVTS